MLSTSSNRCPEQAKELDCFQREQCGLQRAHGWSFLFSIHALFFQQDRRPMQEDCNLLNQTFSGNTTLKLIKKHLNIEHTTRKPVVYVPSFIITRSSGYELFALQSLNSYLVLYWWNDFKKNTHFSSSYEAVILPSFKILYGMEGRGRGNHPVLTFTLLQMASIPWL